MSQSVHYNIWYNVILAEEPNHAHGVAYLKIIVQIIVPHINIRHLYLDC